MTLIINNILSYDKNFPFSNSVEKFFDLYQVDEEVESYYFFPWPMATKCRLSNNNDDLIKYFIGTSAEDLEKIEYKSKVIFWCPMDSFIDDTPFNFYKKKKSNEIEKIEQICKLHPDKFFILLPNFYSLNNLLDTNNLFSVDNMINTNFNKKYLRCNNKIFKDKKWISLNSGNTPHRTTLLSYLISKNLDKTGLISCNQTFFGVNNLKNIFKYFNFEKESRKNLIKGFVKLRKEKFEKLSLNPYTARQDATLCSNIDNYHKNLLPVYRQTALEIISGTLFLEPTPLFGEKEIQSVYAKNFLIFISAKGTAKIFKEVWGMDIFEDIIDHSYDSIDDPAERLKSAVDSNIHLLNGSINLEKIWIENQERFTKNCDQMDKMLYDEEYRQFFDHQKIKQGLDHFNIGYNLK